MKGDTINKTRQRMTHPKQMIRLQYVLAIAAIAFATSLPATAQISFTTAIDLALKNNPRVLAAEAEVEKARAGLAEAKDVYIPTLVGGSGLGYSYGFPLGQPSVFNFTSQSLLINFSQPDYIRAARASLTAANLALKDVRQAVAEDVAVTYIALDRDVKRQAALMDESGYAGKLVTISQARLDAGQDTPIDLTTARLTAAQVRLARLRSEDETAIDQMHLAKLTGLPADGLGIVPSSIPSLGQPTPLTGLALPAASPAVDSAYAIAQAKQQTAFGDARYLWRPQVYFVAQYSLFAKFNNYDLYYQRFQYSNAGIGVDIKFPVFDPVAKNKARESAAEAVRARHQADYARDQFLEGRLKVERTTLELEARAEVASLDRDLARQQLDVILVQIQSGSGNSQGPQMTPKDEQNSRIAEREKYLSYIDAGFNLQQAQINLLRQTGDLENWLKSAVQSQRMDASKPQ